MRSLIAIVLLSACGQGAGAVEPVVLIPDAGVGDAAALVRAPEPEPPALRLPGHVRPDGYELRLELDANKETFAGQVTIQITTTEQTDHVWLHASDLEISSAKLATALALDSFRDMTRLSTSTGDLVGFRWPATYAAGDFVLELEFTGKVASKELDGLFRQQDGGEWYLFSQFEALSARRAFPCFDEPGFKVPWQITVVHPADQDAYSNAPALLHATVEDGRVATSFDVTPHLPSYLIAFAVGRFDVVDIGPVGMDKIPARVLTPRGRADEAAAAKLAIPRIVDALEAYFDEPLPFAKLDSVAVPRFFGAMENPGLITYDAGILLSKDPTQRFRHRLTSIAGHELAHQWFGNFVTLAWWDDLWLNESFATWMADKIAVQLEPSWDRAVRAVETANRAMDADADVAAQPLRRAIGRADDIGGAFDAISYDKGGAVLTMFERWIGEDAFRTGVRAYMRAHARRNASATDFIAALEQASTPEIGAAFLAYLDQPGVPVVHASLTCSKDAAPVVHLRQERLVGFGEKEKGTPQRWPVHACVRWGAGKKGKAAGEACALITGADADLPLTGAACPTWLIGNAGAAGYYRVLYADPLRADLRDHLAQVPAVERMAFAADLGALLGAGKVSAGDTLELVGPLLATGDEHDLGSAVELVAATEALVADDRLPTWRAWVIARLGKRARAATLQGSLDETTAERNARLDLLDLVGVVARDRKLAAKARKLAASWLAGKTTTPPRDLELVLALAARGGDDKLFDAILERARATDGRERATILTSLGYFTGDALVARAHAVLTSGEFDPFTGAGILQAQLESADGARAAGAFVRATWDALIASLPRQAARYLVYLQGRVCDAEARAEVDSFVLARVDAIPDGAEVLADTLSTIDRCIARRVALGADLETAIKAKR